MSTVGAGKKKPAAKRKPAKKTATKTKRKANPALLKPWQPTGALADIIGSKPISRGQATKKVWEYIKKHNLQDKKDGRIIVADAKMKKLFGGKASINMMQLATHMTKCLKKID